MEARLSNLRPPLDLWHRNESGGDLGSQFRVPIGPVRIERCKLKLANSIVCFEKYDFLQTTPNIDILYIIGKHFLSRVHFWAYYLLIHH